MIITILWHHSLNHQSSQHSLWNSYDDPRHRQFLLSEKTSKGGLRLGDRLSNRSLTWMIGGCLNYHPPGCCMRHHQHEMADRLTELNGGFQFQSIGGIHGYPQIIHVIFWYTNDEASSYWDTPIFGIDHRTTLGQTGDLGPLALDVSEMSSNHTTVPKAIQKRLSLWKQTWVSAVSLGKCNSSRSFRGDLSKRWRQRRSVLFSRVTGWFRGTNPASSLADQTPWMMVGIDEAVRKWQEVRCVIDCRLSICHGVKVKTMPFWVLKVLYTSIYIYTDYTIYIWEFVKTPRLFV